MCFKNNKQFFFLLKFLFFLEKIFRNFSFLFSHLEKRFSLAIWKIFFHRPRTNETRNNLRQLVAKDWKHFIDWINNISSASLLRCCAREKNFPLLHAFGLLWARFSRRSTFSLASAGEHAEWDVNYWKIIWREASEKFLRWGHPKKSSAMQWNKIPQTPIMSWTFLTFLHNIKAAWVRMFLLSFFQCCTRERKATEK